jgi:hypothetical protein
VYEAYQKSADELHAYLEANYRQFQIAGTDFAWHFYNKLTEVNKCNNAKVQEALHQSQQWLVAKADMFSR